MRDDANPAIEYRRIAKAIVERIQRNLARAISMGQAEPYWSLEQNIVDAMVFADHLGSERTRKEMLEIVKDFDDNDGTSSS